MSRKSRKFCATFYERDISFAQHFLRLKYLNSEFESKIRKDLSE